MCGIIGYISRNNININASLSEMEHRGPDHESVSYRFSNGSYIGLGHVRLSIIDLDKSSNQPFFYKERYKIIYNGEIYNYVELRDELIANGYAFDTKSDTEVLVAAYDFYKEKVFDFLDGIFAFCIYDMLEEEVILARDHLGVKPLYYHFIGGELYFSSELKSLFSFHKVKKEISQTQICEFLLNGWLYEPDTGFDKVLKVRPGEFLKYSLVNNGLIKKRYFDVSEKKNEAMLFRDKSIDELINNSVDIQCRSDVPIGIFFSGGIDSTVIAVKTQNPKCLSVRYSGEDLELGSMGDDFYYSKKLSSLLGLDLTAVPLEKSDNFLNSIRRVVRYNEELISDYTYIASEDLSNVAKNMGYKVMLSGMGADEIFGGYPRYKVVKYEKFFRNIFRLVEPFYSILLKSKFFGKKIDRFFSFFREDSFIFSYGSLLGYFTKDEVRKIIINDADIDRYFSKVSKLLDNVSDMTPFKKAFYLDLYGFLPHNFIVADKSSMQASIELRVPLVNKNLLLKNFYEEDNKILDFFNSKKQLRSILSGKIDNNIINRKKTGFNPPLDKFINDLGESSIIKELSSSNLKDYINLDYVLFLVREHFLKRKNNTYKIWQILYLNFWIVENE